MHLRLHLSAGRPCFTAHACRSERDQEPRWRHGWRPGIAHTGGLDQAWWEALGQDGEHAEVHDHRGPPCQLLLGALEPSRHSASGLCSIVLIRLPISVVPRNTAVKPRPPPPRLRHSAIQTCSAVSHAQDRYKVGGATAFPDNHSETLQGSFDLRNVISIKSAVPADKTAFPEVIEVRQPTNHTLEPNHPHPLQLNHLHALQSSHHRGRRPPPPPRPPLHRWSIPRRWRRPRVRSPKGKAS